jgi:hypothetical protein
MSGTHTSPPLRSLTVPDPNALLAWASANSCGSWESLRAAASWVTGDRDLGGYLVRNLSDLGHVELDWERRTWRVCPGVLATLPYAGMRAIFAGQRTPDLLAALRNQADLDDLDIWLDIVPQPGAPDMVSVTSRTIADIAELAARLAVDYVEYPALRITNYLWPGSQLALGPPSPPPAGDYERWDAPTGRWAVSERNDGLFRIEHYGQRYVFSEGQAAFFHVDLSVGRYMELHRRGLQVLRFREDGLTGTLSLPLVAPLPSLLARCASLFTGLVPQRRGQELTYANVPLVAARAIGQSLDQEVVMTQQWKPAGGA